MPSKLLQNLSLVTDLGNGNCKVYTKQHGLIVIPSLSRECSRRIEPGNVSLSDGTSYCFGNLEQSRGVPTAQDQNVKVHDIRKLFLGVLANLQLKQTFSKNLSIEVYLLSHAYYDFHDVLKANLTFKETVCLRGEEFNLSVHCKKVFPEAFGAQFVQRSSNKPLMIFDFGSGTTQAISYEDKDAKPHIEPVGVHHLIKIICDKGIKLNAGYPLDYHEVNMALKAQTLKTAYGIDFSSIYLDSLKEWFHVYLPETIKMIKTSSRYEKHAVGGGCLLPQMKGALKDKGVSLVENPVTFSVSGTYQFLSKKGLV
jgi:hypothetical protein